MGGGGGGGGGVFLRSYLISNSKRKTEILNRKKCVVAMGTEAFELVIAGVTLRRGIKYNYMNVILMILHSFAVLNLHVHDSFSSKNLRVF